LLDRNKTVPHLWSAAVSCLIITV